MSVRQPTLCLCQHRLLRGQICYQSFSQRLQRKSPDSYQDHLTCVASAAIKTGRCRQFLSLRINSMLTSKTVMKIVLSFILLSILSCGHRVKYEMNNMLPEIVDVTGFIESGKYFPDSCDGALIRLISTKPLILDDSYETELQAKLESWKSGKSATLEIPDIYKKTIYQYSYLLTSEPIDVYKTSLDSENKLFIRLKDGKIFDEFKEDGWVISKCDSIK